MNNQFHTVSLGTLQPVAVKLVFLQFRLHNLSKSTPIYITCQDNKMSFFKFFKLQVEIDDPRPAYAPNDEIKLKLTASPQSNVYLVAVDKGVYVLNNKNRLTQTKVSNCYLESAVDKLVIFGKFIYVYGKWQTPDLKTS